MDRLKRTMRICLLSASLMVCGHGCSGSNVVPPKGTEGALADCPGPPNCVSSEARDTRHAIEPFRLQNQQPDSWDAIGQIVASLPRTTIVQQSDRYLHAECKSRLFGFIDDLELLLDPEAGIVAVRSSSRVGRWDMGVNRRRIEILRQRMAEEGWLDQ